MNINLWELPFNALFKIIIKLKHKELIKLRQCSRKIDNFVELHRFDIAKKNVRNVCIEIRVGEEYLEVFADMLKKTDTTAIPIYVKLENSYEQLSAFSFEQITIEWRYETRETIAFYWLQTLLALLQPVCTWLAISVSHAPSKIPSKEEMDLGMLINFRYLNLVFDDDIAVSDIVPYSVLEKPIHIKLHVYQDEEFSFLGIYPIIKNKRKVEIVFLEDPDEFSLFDVETVVNEITEFQEYIPPELTFTWHCYDVFCPPVSDMNLLFMNMDEFHICDHRIYGKALRFYFLILHYHEGLEFLHLDVIHKTKSALRRYLEKCTKEDVQEEEEDFDDVEDDDEESEDEDEYIEDEQVEANDEKEDIEGEMFDYLFDSLVNAG